MKLRDRLVGFGYHLLYNQLAWTYDAVAWLVSKGEWQRWGQAALESVDGSDVLEVGSGPGHLLSTLAAHGYRAVGLDVSAAMMRRARRNLTRDGGHVPLVRGRAEALPFVDCSFDTVVMTFPAAFVVRTATRREVWRVLVPGGRWVIADSAHLVGSGLWARTVNLAFRLTSVHLPPEVLQALFEGEPLPQDVTELAGGEIEAGDPAVSFELSWRDARTHHALVRLLVATRV